MKRCRVNLKPPRWPYEHPPSPMQPPKAESGGGHARCFPFPKEINFKIEPESCSLEAPGKWITTSWVVGFLLHPWAIIRTEEWLTEWMVNEWMSEWKHKSTSQATSLFSSLQTEWKTLVSLITEPAKRKVFRAHRISNFDLVGLSACQPVSKVDSRRISNRDNCFGWNLASWLGPNSASWQKGVVPLDWKRIELRQLTHMLFCHLTGVWWIFGG